MARRRPPPALLALLGYALIALLFFGLPVLRHPRGTLLGFEEIEPSQFMWFLAWWPHALLHGENPFLTRALLVPEGYNLAWTTGIPGPSLVLAPLTLAFGPVLSYNALALAAPVLDAGAAFLLCRRVTRSFWPAMLGGYLFGFSSFVVGGMQGVPNLTTLALVPLGAYLVVRSVEGCLSRARFVLGLTLALVGQFLISNEVLALATLFGGATYLAAFVLWPERRRALLQTAGATGIAYGVATVLVSPYLYFMVAKPSIRPYPDSAKLFSADLASFAVPTGLHWVGGSWFPSVTQSFQGIFHGDGYGYLGLPLLLLVALFVVERRRERTGALLGLVFALTLVASLGPRLHVAGHDVAPAPWRAVSSLPLLEYAVPASFAIYTALAAAVIAAMWLARRPSPWRWALAGAAVVCLLPAFGSGRWNHAAPEPAFFHDGLYRHELVKRDRVLVVPWLGANMRWQAQTRFGFRLVGGYVNAHFPPEYARFYHLIAAQGQAPTPAGAARVRAFMVSKRVTAVVVDESRPGYWRALFASLGVAPRTIGGVLLYRLSPAPAGDS